MSLWVGVWWWFVPLFPKVAKVSMVALSMMKTLFVATPRQSCSAVQEILLEKQRHLQMVLDLCLALQHLCQHSHNIGHRQVSSAWPIKAHRKEDTIFFSDASITHVQRAGKIMEHGGRAAKPRQSHPSQSSKCINHFH